MENIAQNIRGEKRYYDIMEKNTKLWKIFITFLKVNGAYMRYRANILPIRVRNVGSTLAPGLAAAFSWSKTKEGYKYWYDLYEKWAAIRQLTR